MFRFKRWSVLMVGLICLGLILSACGDDSVAITGGTTATTGSGQNGVTTAADNKNTGTSSSSNKSPNAENFGLSDSSGLTPIQLSNAVQQAMVSGSQRKTGLKILAFTSDKEPDAAGQLVDQLLKKQGYKLADTSTSLDVSPDGNSSRGQYTANGLPDVYTGANKPAAYLEFIKLANLSGTDFDAFKAQIGSKASFVSIAAYTVLPGGPNLITKAPNGVVATCPFSVPLTLKEESKDSYNKIITAFNLFLGIGTGTYAFFAVNQPLRAAQVYCENEMKYRHYDVRADIITDFAGIPTYIAYRPDLANNGTEYQITQFYAAQPDVTAQFKESTAGYQTIYIVYQTFKPGAPVVGAQPSATAGAVAAADRRKLTKRGKNYDYGNVLEVAFTPDGKILVLLVLNDNYLSGRGTIFFQDVESGKILRTIYPETYQYHGLSVSPDGKNVGYGEGSKVVIVNAENQLVSKTFDTNQEIIGTGFSSDNKTFLTSHTNGLTRIWDLNTKKEITNFQASAAAFSPDGKSVVLGSGPTRVGILRVADISTKQISVNMSSRAEANPVYSSDGKFIYSISSDGMTVWDAATGQKQRTVAGVKNYFFAVSSDNKWVADVSGGYLTVRDIASGQVVTSTQTGSLCQTCGGAGITFAPGGKTILALGTLWDVS